LGGSSVLDSDYLTMLSSSDKLMSGEFEALERLQAELELFDDPNRPEEIVEQMVVESHLDLIEEEVCSDPGDAIINELTNIKNDDLNSNDNLESSIESHMMDPNIQIKTEHIVDDDDDDEVISISEPQSPDNFIPEVLSVTSVATKRSAPSTSIQGNQPSKKSVI